MEKVVKLVHKKNMDYKVIVVWSLHLKTMNQLKFKRKSCRIIFFFVNRMVIKLGILSKIAHKTQRGTKT